ncbi:small nuclear ribonucleoprotein SmD3 [Trypanosoma rangeli]|uniref:Small nuclear ribonucleoprotein Sm D3 n=1 Tax=Trypanosoma rangeli TaxID=5698 RepID=A0A422NSZ6_TRYRA|nr:small nuclear ribonucleoprotein SmD3 [Trypanosoma rangeli]RNF08576.1 small nuclear ribonucleoprotein SmD3 [Trypanosoma rangeli]|eukprot:RNF08576.1 small nuclear ribonucleoprotein SmD3 [Trypanosoma rangeli]
MSTFSIPLKVLFDAIGTTISLEVSNGELYTGTLSEVQDNMNVMLTAAKKTVKSGRTVEMKSVFVRGASIVFFQLPDALRTSPALVKAGQVMTNALDDRGNGKGFGARRTLKRGRD